ncbi:MAG: NfeD family protein [Planctomycetia bacterium]|jgi:membrane protein implicated in regulation of membrane protease activity|nr:NfeD family protein [Planctomycetia bacterium]
MALLFLVCAVVGGTILICQFVLTLVGLGGEHGIDFSHDMAHDFAGDAGHDAPGGGTHGASSDDHATDQQQASSWLFAVISFRTLVAAIAFFGLVGSAAQSAGQPVGVQLLLAIAAGVGAMYGVHWLIRSISRLGTDATLRVKNALGQEGTVYVPIAGNRAQTGKIQLKVQNRLVEFEAVTSIPERLATGTKVRVVGMTGSVLEVEPVGQVSSSKFQVSS